MAPTSTSGNLKTTTQDLEIVFKSITDPSSSKTFGKVVTLVPCTHRVEKTRAKSLFTGTSNPKNEKIVCPVCKIEVSSYQPDPQMSTLCKKLPQILDEMSTVINQQSYTQYRKGTKYYLWLLEQKKKTLGENHPDIALALFNVGNTYIEKKQYDMAIEYCMQAINHPATVKKEHLYVASMFNNLGVVYFYKGMLNEALACFMKALETEEKVEKDLVVALHNIANIYYGLGQFSKAIIFFERELPAAEKCFGKEHPSTLESIKKLEVCKKSIEDSNQNPSGCLVQ